MENDTFDQIKRESKKGKYDDYLDISSTGYGYESHHAIPFEKNLKNHSVIKSNKK
ncbi:hypothetical protein [Niallia sp. 03133]|uniref:hypothetical protein n=1 Tax=Niallia sp. 03133 TaxID=3458060 RepID=UPI0040440E35